MDCDARLSDKINHFCWADENTIVAMDIKGKQLLKFEPNMDNKTCLRTVLVEYEYDQKESRMACSKNGVVYVSEREDYDEFTGIRIYDVKSKEIIIWVPGEFKLDGRWQVFLAVNNNTIVITFSHLSYVYDKDRQFLYWMRNPYIPMFYELSDTYLTPSNYFWGCQMQKTQDSGLVFVTDLQANTSHVFDDINDIRWPFRITGLRNGYVIVDHNYKYEHGYRVYTENGTYQNLLPVDKEGSRDMSMIMSNQGENLLALGPIKESIKIYVVEPGPPSSGVITKAHSWLIALCVTFMMSFLNFNYVHYFIRLVEI